MGGLNQVTVAGRIVHLALDPDQSTTVGVLDSDGDFIPFRASSFSLKKGQQAVLSGRLRGLREMLNGVPKVRSFLELSSYYVVTEDQPVLQDSQTIPSTTVHTPAVPVSQPPDACDDDSGAVFQGPELPWPTEELS